jgi:hypothetical protein
LANKKKDRKLLRKQKAIKKAESLKKKEAIKKLKPLFYSLLCGV